MPCAVSSPLHTYLVFFCSMLRKLFFTSGNCERSEQIWKQRFSSRLTAADIAFQWVDCCIRLSVHALVWLLLCIIPPFFPGRR